MGELDLRREHEIRMAAMAYVRRRADAHPGGVVTREVLENFTFEDERIKLLDKGRGIRNPSQLAATLTIMTSNRSVYDDSIGEDGFTRYDIRDGELGEGDNRKLRRAYELQLPLIWFQMVRSGVYVPQMPVYLAEEEPGEKRYVVALGEDQLLMVPAMLESTAEKSLASSIEQRRYVERMSRQRLHQPAFRAGVMLAYGSRCAVCSLTRGGLLDAAHIVPDGEPKGDPVVPNGLSLCKIHHAAYDQDILGVSPERVIRINADVLAERDGPMLRHGLQEFHGATLRVVPTRAADMPDPERLAVRYERFLAAG